MHLIVDMADTASSTLLQWEISNASIVDATSHPSSALPQKSESGIVRLIRTVCKGFCKHASEKCGVHQHFMSFLKCRGVIRNPLATF